MKRAKTFMRRRGILLVINNLAEKSISMYRSTSEWDHIHKMTHYHRLVAVDGAHFDFFHVTNVFSNFGVAEPSLSEELCQSYHHWFQIILNTFRKMNPLIARTLSEAAITSRPTGLRH